jgi:hypothetical protein
MARKGMMAEILSKALHCDDPKIYSIGFLDLGKIKETTLEEFLILSDHFEIIPASRIICIKKCNKKIYSKITT